MTKLSKRIKRKNQALQSLIFDLLEASREQDAPVWRAAAEHLSSPTRQQPTVNLHELSDVEATHVLLIPGKVLGSGVLRHDDVTVAAHKFSSTAEETINQNGEAKSIRELLVDNETGQDIKLVL